MGFSSLRITASAPVSSFTSLTAACSFVSPFNLIPDDDLWESLSDYNVSADRSAQKFYCLLFYDDTAG